MSDSAQKLVIRNIGLMLSGKMEAPIYEADCIIAYAGKIAGWGREADMNLEGADTVIDANGVTLAPGLIDSHIHPVIGDYTPRQQQLHWIDSTLHGGVTTLISAGEVHMPGRPKDVVGLKAMAIAAQRWYENFRPSGMKVHAGAPVIEHGMVEQDFKDLADAGVTLLDEPSMGLAPQLVEQIFEIVKKINEEQGVTILLAEQNTNVALRYAHYGYILESGRVVMDGPAAELRENPDVKEFYLGMSDEGRKSFRDVRSYRRRKRWLS